MIVHNFARQSELQRFPAVPPHRRVRAGTQEITLKHRSFALASLAILAACGETPTNPTELVATAARKPAAAALTQQVYASGVTPVTAYDPIFPAVADPTWPTTSCTANPAVGPNASWQNPHPAVTGFYHPWINDWFTGAGWINAWDERNWQGVPPSKGPDGQSWTKYETQVQGTGSFVIQLLADNCSWIYLDGNLVGVQNTTPTTVSYGLTLNGTHTLSFIIFDGGGAAGGKFKLETTTNPPPPLNNDLDGDGHPNATDAFPLDPLRWDAANAISNGSFERPIIGATWSPNADKYPWQTFDTQGQGLPGWHVDAGNVDTQSGEVAFQLTGVPDGVQVLDLNSAAVSQSVTTKAHYKYRVSFALSKNYVCVSGNASVHVSFGGGSQDFTFMPRPGEAATNMRWDADTFEAVSTGTATTLQFTATEFGGCGGPEIDAVKVEEIGPADVTPPSIIPTVTGTLNGDWYTSNVGITWAVSDLESAVSSTSGCDASSVTQDTNGVTFTCTATSAGGVATRSVTIKRDASAPVITPTVVGTLGLASWYTSNVTVSWTTADATSGIASTSVGCTATTTAADNAGTTYACTATNGAGLTATQSVTAKRDATKPNVVYTGNLGSYTVDQSVAITCAASDAMSGVASTTCANIAGYAYAFTIGANNYSATAKDVAGNLNSASTSFTVKVTPASLCALVKRFVTKSEIAKSLCEQLVNGENDKPEAGDDGKSKGDGKGDGKGEVKSPTQSDLKDFREHVQAQAGKGLSAANANLLIALSKYL